ncbi:MAG: adenylate/guanylate cyclase domain-containing protein, partial [Bacteriovoracaceae bacterium]
YSWVTFLNFNQASAEKKQIKGAFSRYVAPAIVNDMLEHPDKLKVGGEKRNITCLFSDVRDFTSISEQLSPSDLGWALNRYMGKMTDIVFETNGTLDKYIGDAIVAFWGAPLDIGDHVNKALEGAVGMLEALPAINEEFKQKGLPEFKIGLGLNSGDCSVGNMGSDQIFAYTALGDAMNLGARLESLCKHYGAQILVSEHTFEKMDQSKFTARLIDKVKVKGKTEPVGVYEVLYSYHPMSLEPEALIQFKKAYELFIVKDFARAKEMFESVLEKIPEDKSSLRMKEVCQLYIENPPAVDEDHTITTMTTK